MTTPSQFDQQAYPDEPRGGNRGAAPSDEIADAVVDRIGDKVPEARGQADIPSVTQAVALRDGRAPDIELEASGGVSLATVAAIAAAGVERISVGALTHSAPALDLAFDWKLTVDS